MLDKSGNNGNSILITEDSSAKTGNSNKTAFCNTFSCCFLTSSKISSAKTLYASLIESLATATGVTYLSTMCLGALPGLKPSTFNFLFY
ncbi:Hypothetical protein BC85_0143 [Mycoplasmopsis bovis]|nr:Hypothetical protein BC85_0143 [Mycoplasmopsis bovis]